jgi:hypothetical protein
MGFRDGEVFAKGAGELVSLPPDGRPGAEKMALQSEEGGT